MEKAESFKNNKLLSSISDCFTSPTIVSDDSSTSSDSDIPGPALRMPRPIRYSRLSHPPENLSRSTTPDLPPPGTLEYYLASVITNPQRMTPELEDLPDSVPYASPLPFAENTIENNEDHFSFEDLPLPPNQGKEKEPIRPWELVADDIAEALELSLASPIKKSIKRAKRRSVTYHSCNFTSATRIKPFYNLNFSTCDAVPRQ